MTNNTTAPDLIDRLRFCGNLHPQFGHPQNGILFIEAAVALEAAQARIAELERHLGGSLAVITDYLEYEHDGDPWTEDARTMGEMEINEYERSGRLKEARAALQEGKGCS